MLPKKYRLTVFEFNRIPQPAKTYQNAFFSIKLKKQDNKLQFVVTVPKYLDKRSSYRHLTKRKIVEEIKKERKNMREGHEVWIRAKKIMGKKETDVLSVQLQNLLKTAGVL